MHNPHFVYIYIYMPLKINIDFINSQRLLTLFFFLGAVSGVISFFYIPGFLIGRH